MASEAAFRRFVLNRKISMRKILYHAGVEVPASGTLFCPFHADESHKSAKIYPDGENETVFCFAERKTYRPVDVLMELLGGGEKEINGWFTRLWNAMGREEQTRLRLEFSHPCDYLSPEWKKSRRRLKGEFKAGLIPVGVLLREVMEILNPS